MSRVSCLVLAALSSVAACSQKEEVKPIDEASLRNRFQGYCDWRLRGAAVPLADATWIATGADQPPAAPSKHTVELHATANGLRLHPYDELAWGVPELDRKLRQVLASTQADTSKDPEEKSGVRWRLLAAPETPAIRVTQLLDRLVLAGYPLGSVALAYDTSRAPPAPDAKQGAALSAEVMALPRKERARWFSEQLTPAQEACPALAVSLREVALVEQDGRCDTLARGVSAALAQCPALLKAGEAAPTLLWLLMAGDATRAVAVVDTTVDWTLPPQRFATDATWADLAKAAVTDSAPKTLRFAPEGSDAAPSWVDTEALERQCVEGFGIDGSAPYRACMHLCLTEGDPKACAKTMPAFRDEHVRRQRWLGWLCDERKLASACHELAETHDKGSPEARAALDKGLALARAQCGDPKARDRKAACVEAFMLLSASGADDKEVRAGMQAACDLGDKRSCKVMKSDFGLK